MPPDTDTPGYREEVKRYPPETKAILSGGSLLGADYVAKKLVRGIANQKKRIAVGAEARFLLLAMRFMPKLWDGYTRAKKRSARKRMAKAAASGPAPSADEAPTPSQEVPSTPDTGEEPAAAPSDSAEQPPDPAADTNDAPPDAPADDDVIVMPDDSGEDSRQASA